MDENPVTQEGHYQEKLESLGADRECPACGVNPKWVTINNRNAHDVTAVLPFRNQDMKMGTVAFAGLTVVNVACNNCGYIRQHSTRIIDRTLEGIIYYEDQKK